MSMGSANHAMWKVVGVKADQSSICFSIPQPAFNGQDLYLLADVPYILKNTRNCLLAQNILLPADIVNEYDLPSNVVSMEHVKKVVTLEQNSDFNEKMKVGITVVVRPRLFSML